jgi:hypothetical protein
VGGNPRAGTPLGRSESGNRVGTGDIEVANSTIVEAFTEPGVHDIETAPYWIRAQALPPKVVQDYFGLEDKPAADVNALMTPTARGFLAGGRNRDQTTIPLTLVLTMYERPHGNEEGRVVTVVGDKAFTREWPFPFKDRLNCVALRETYVAHQWAGESIVYQGLSVQNGINAVLSTFIEHVKLAGNARLMVPDLSIDLIEMLTDEPGEVIPYNSSPGGGRPDYLSPPQLPGWLVQGAERLDARLDDLMGIHDISRGDAPTNIQSGVGLSILSENDDTPVGFIAQEMGDGFGRLMSLCLQTYAANVQEKRRANISHPDGVTDIFEWNGADLKNQTTAIVPIDAVLPRSRAALRAQAMEMVKLGLIKSLDEYELMADVSWRDRLSVNTDKHGAKARRENHVLSEGIAALPAKFDNHRHHIEIHNGFRTTRAYELLSDEEREIVDAHVEAHEVLAAEDAAKKLEQTAVSPALANAPEANEGEPLPAVGGVPSVSMNESGVPPQLGGGAEQR